MSDLRTGFAAIPPEPQRGQVRDFTRHLAKVDLAADDDTVVVIYRGERTFYANPAELAEAIRRQTVTPASAAPKPAPNRSRLSRLTPLEILIGIFIGVQIVRAVMA